MADADGAVTGESGGSLGPKRLTTIHAVGQALGIGPIFSAGAVTGLVAAVAGFNTPLSILLGSIGALGIAYVVSLYARRFVGAGAMYEYLARAVNNSFGIFSGGTYLVGALMLGSGGIFLGLCFLVQGFFASHLHANIPWWAGGLAGLLIALTLNYFGVRLAVRGVLTLCGLSAIPFLILSVVIIAKGGASGNTLSVFNPNETSINTVFNGILFAILLFVGFEAAASIAEEMRAPRDRIPVAVLGTVAVSALFFLLVCYAATIGFGKEALAHNAWGGSPDAMGDLAQHYVGTWLSVLIDLAIIFDALSLGIAIMVTSSRLLFALGRDRLLPQWLGTTSRYNTPGGRDRRARGLGDHRSTVDGGDRLRAQRRRERDRDVHDLGQRRQLPRRDDLHLPRGLRPADRLAGLLRVRRGVAADRGRDRPGRADPRVQGVVGSVPDLA